MVNTRFMFNHNEYQVWGEYGTNEITGEVTWMCRGLYTDNTIYLTTEDINNEMIFERGQSKR